ncbi:MAG: glycosyltransferase family 4 protein [Alphaproteobacteria bacterium]|nr:glycosyltransferase family 4 protein [Alphaproteobacteria bacterium]MBP7759982.1 glycosyltransferase family 4 protein [Alphaproteobacteria bacterium]MBP7763352.1 glycosyltransferase family 4 protein [Alphaproteobacteria bacterium]MBP7905333.1 glycosyltransferase family 4 protein [Alphaproteobacteria bacterium]
MKLMFVIKTMTHGTGGAERVLSQITSELCGLGHEVSLVTFDSLGQKPFYALDERIRRIDLGLGDPQKKSGVAITLKRISALRRTARSEQPDAVIAFMHSAFVPAAFAFVGTGIPVIGSEHIVPAYYDRRKLEFAFFLFSLPFLRKITVVSKKIRDSYPAFARRKMVVVPNPVKRPLPGLEGLRDLTKRPVILNVGRLDPQKDQETLIRAFSALTPRFPDWDLRIIGEGGLRPELENLISELNLKGRVFLPGLSGDIDREYAAASLFVIPSRYEAFGLATAEAMTYGIPAIGFADCPGTNEIIEDGHNGLLAKGEHRVNALAEFMEKLMKSKEYRKQLGEKASVSHAQLTPESIARLWDDFLRGIISP